MVLYQFTRPAIDRRRGPKAGYSARPKTLMSMVSPNWPVAKRLKTFVFMSSTCPPKGFLPRLCSTIIHVGICLCFKSFKINVLNLGLTAPLHILFLDYEHRGLEFLLIASIARATIDRNTGLLPPMEQSTVQYNMYLWVRAQTPRTITCALTLGLRIQTLAIAGGLTCTYTRAAKDEHGESK